MWPKIDYMVAAAHCSGRFVHSRGTGRGITGHYKRHPILRGRAGPWMTSLRHPKGMRPLVLKRTKMGLLACDPTRVRQEILAWRRPGLCLSPKI